MIFSFIANARVILSPTECVDSFCEFTQIAILLVYEVTEEPLNLSNVDEQIIHDREILGFPLNNLVEGRLLGVDDETINLLKRNTQHLPLQRRKLKV